MSDKKISRRKTLGLIGLTGAAASGAGAGTYAYLSDEDSIESIFEVGSLVIDMSPSDGGLEFNSLGEGEESESSISVCNQGSLPIRNVIIDSVDIEGEMEVAKALKVLDVSYAGNVVATGSDIGDSNGNGIADLADFQAWVGDGKSLTSLSETNGLGVSEEDSDCEALVVRTKMDYSVLPSSVENNASMSASVNLIGQQHQPQ